MLRLRRVLLAGCVIAVAAPGVALATPINNSPLTITGGSGGSALASTTVGQTGTPLTNFSEGSGAEKALNSAAMPAAGIVTSFHTQSSSCTATGGSGGTYDFQILRPLGGMQYQVLGDTGSQTDPCDGQLHSYPVNIPVQAGDVIGVYVVRDWDGVLSETSGSMEVAFPIPEPAVGSAVTLVDYGVETLDESATLVTGSDQKSDSDLALTVPSNLTVNATSPSGATVTYTASATDENLATVSVNCSPTSGSTFAIGTTTVTCAASDSDGDGNSPVQKTFTVHVNGGAEQLSDLASAVAGVGSGTSLTDKVASGQSYLSSGDTSDACGTLAAFINEVNAQSGKSIAASSATTLASTAQRIQVVIGCH